MFTMQMPEWVIICELIVSKYFFLVKVQPDLVYYS